MKKSEQRDISKPNQPSIEGSRLLYIIHSQGRDVKRMPLLGNYYSHDFKKANHNYPKSLAFHSRLRYYPIREYDQP